MPTERWSWITRLLEEHDEYMAVTFEHDGKHRREYGPGQTVPADAPHAAAFHKSRLIVDKARLEGGDSILDHVRQVIEPNSTDPQDVPGLDGFVEVELPDTTNAWKVFTTTLANHPHLLTSMTPGRHRPETASSNPDPEALAVNLVHVFRDHSHTHFFSHAHYFSHAHFFSHAHYFIHDGKPAYCFADHQNQVSQQAPGPDQCVVGAYAPPNTLDAAALEAFPVAGKRIGLIDTGYDCSHPWLMSNRVSGDDDSPGDLPNGHGTMVTGLLRQGAPGSEITVLRRVQAVEGCILETALVEAIGQLQQAGVQVLCLSFGADCYGAMAILEKALMGFVEGGGTVVAAAGNRHDDHHGNAEPLAPMYPAAWPCVLAVAGGRTVPTKGSEPDAAALNEPHNYYTWSNGGDWVDAIITLTPGPLDGDAKIQGENQLLLSSAHHSSGGQFVFVNGTSVLAALAAAQLASGSIRNAHELGRA